MNETVMPQAPVTADSLAIHVGSAILYGDLNVPVGATGLVLFAHGSGSSRYSSRNRFVARQLQKARVATLLFDLLTPAEEQVDLRTQHLRFDIPLLASRLVGATEWASADRHTRGLRAGYFGARAHCSLLLRGKGLYVQLFD